MDWVTLGSGKRPVVIVAPAVLDSELEIGIRQLSADEHKDLHQDALKTVNRWKMFDKPVTTMTLTAPEHSPSATGTYTLVAAHWPDCNARGACLYKK